VRIRLLDLIGRESIITLKQDKQYWPTKRIFYHGESWKITQQEL
jgi:pro-apoptotic serine protease NMA111